MTRAAVRGALVQAATELLPPEWSVHGRRQAGAGSLFLPAFQIESIFDDYTQSARFDGSVIHVATVQFVFADLTSDDFDGDEADAIADPGGFLDQLTDWSTPAWRDLTVTRVGDDDFVISGPGLFRGVVAELRIA